jgi:site-specific DNA-methyltransferase (adenine-specific)
MPKSCGEPWGLFRKPCEGRIQDNLRKCKAGGGSRDGMKRSRIVPSPKGSAARTTAGGKLAA